MWDGDQVLAEIRYPNAVPDQDAGLDPENAAAAVAAATTTTVGGHPYGGPNTSEWAQSGRVVYVHGAGIDQPLALIRMDYSHNFAGPILIIPHANWRGVYETASFGAGESSHCDDFWMPANEVAQFDSMGHRTNP